MSAMLGSSRRDSRPKVRVRNGEIVLVERPAGSLRALMARLITRLEVLFGPLGTRP
ncbi:MAG: hypothetical protein ABSC51_02425 [Gaiellaceae bacterium]|jgi:hypothetical protein